MERLSSSFNWGETHLGCPRSSDFLLGGSGVLSKTGRGLGEPIPPRMGPLGSIPVPSAFGPVGDEIGKNPTPSLCLSRSGPIRPIGANRPKKPAYNLLRYELAREALQRGIRSNSPDGTLFASIFPDHFPSTPYLAIPAKERIKIWRTAFDPKKSQGLPRFDPGEVGTAGLVYQFHYLPPEGEEPSTPEQLAALEDDDCDQTCAVVNMALDFDYPDSQLIQAFGKMLRQIRKTEPVFEKRGSASVDVTLKQLAAFRLVHHLGSEADVDAFLGQKNFKPPYEGPSGWSKAKSKIAQLLDGYFYVSGQSARPARKS